MNQIQRIFLSGLMCLSVGLQAAETIVAPAVYTPIQLSRVAIDVHKKMVAEDIAFNKKLKPALIITLASAGVITAGAAAYQSIAACNSLLSWGASIKDWLISCFWTIPSKQVVVTEILFNSISTRVGTLENERYATLFAFITIAGHVGMYALFNERFKSIADSILNSDSYKRFLTHSSLLKEIDFMRHSAHIIETPNQAAINKEYHTKELVRLSEEVILQAEEVIAFLEYKAENSSVELVAQYALDAKGPYLFAITNELITELMAVLSASSDKKLVSLIDAYRAEVKLMIDTCCAIH